jgi:NitT/TauT family transport system permease protein
MSELQDNEVAGERAVLDALLVAPEAPAAPARSSARSVLARLRLRTWLPPLIAFAVLATVWELYAHAHPFVIPSLEHMWQSLRENPHMYWSNLLVTLREIAIGGLGGITAAFLLAVLMVELPIFETALMPLMVVLMVTPIVAIAPALVVAFGFGVLPKYLVTGIVVFYPMLVNSLAGLRDVDDRALDVFTTLHANRWETFRRLRVPSSLPFVFAGLRIALPLSIVGATIAEFSAAGQQAGLGALIQVAASQANLPIIWCSILLLCLLGLTLVIALALIRRKVLFWDNASARRT